MTAVELLSHPFVLQGAKLNAQEELAPLLTEYQLVLRDKMRVSLTLLTGVTFGN
jgi:hypothetical protein